MQELRREGSESMSELRNAKIESTHLGFEDHGIMTFYLHLKYDGTGQGFGGYGLDDGPKGTAFGMVAVRKVLETVGVSKWEDLPGKYIRAETDWSKIHRIGNIIEDKWLDLKVLSEEFHP